MPKDLDSKVVDSKVVDSKVVDEFENATWSRCAGSYMDGFGALVAGAIDPLLSTVKLKRGDQLLDIGSGPGLVAAEANQRGAEGGRHRLFTGDGRESS